MNPILKDYIKSNFPLTKTDLFAVFLEKGLEMIKDYGFNCMVTMQSWMFLSSFEKFRKKLIETTTISNLLHMDNMVMRIAFGTSATVFRKINLMNYNSTFYHVKLSDVENDIVNPLFFNDKNKFSTIQTNFNKISGNPIAYWVTDDLYESFTNGIKLQTIADVKVGLQTGDNNKFLRFWFEPTFKSINFNCSTLEDSINSKKKWFPYNKGGSYRKWYGNNEYVVNFYNFGEDIKQTGKGSFSNSDYYFSKGLTWSRISSRYFGVRFSPQGFIFDVNGPSLFIPEKYYLYIGGLLCSKLSTILLSILNPTISFQAGNINTLPIIFDDSKLDLINNIVKLNIEISKKDWDENEISWDYIKHFSLKSNSNNLKDIYGEYVNFKENEFIKMKNNEIKLNKIIYNLYNITEEFEIKDDDITLNKMNKTDFIKSFISYAIGCMFGRYSLDNEGLQFAGGEFNINNYNKFIPDDDNIIPVLDTAYFDDDIVGYFTKFVETCFGKETLEENLDFIAGALSKSKKPSREIIRQYLLKNFFNDHKRTYKKCPIYWQFSSGKHNGFNCLVYMHRYEPSLVARIRTDYLHKTQKAIEQRIANNDNIINNSTSKQEVANATKEKAKLQKQLKETQEYDEVLAHIANQNIEIDLDDGVKVNYAKFQNIEIKKEGSKTKKVNLLKKI